MGLNVLTDRCFPVVMRSGERRWVDFAGLACGFSAFDAPEAGADYAVAFDWPRPDLDIACHELSIGVLQLCLDVQSEDDWQALWDSALSRDELAERIAPFTHAFELLGDGPRFLQDREAFEADLKPSAFLPIERLFIDAPGENALKKNSDVLTHRCRYPALGLPAAAMALYALQAFAPEGGPGHRTSMRGGGPLSVFVFPVAGTERAPVALWHRLQANLTELAVGESSHRIHTILPWLVPTLTSEKDQTIYPDAEGAAHPLQAFFGMPRRLRLLASAQQGICALTGQEGLVLTGFVQRQHGVKYGSWTHPLTPYRQPTETDAPRSVKPRSIRFGYRDWVAAAVGEGEGRLSRMPANVHAARYDRGHVLLGFGRDPILRVGGWFTNSAEAVTYLLAEQPMHLAENNETAKALDELTRSFADAGNVAREELRSAIKRAFPPKTNKNAFSPKNKKSVRLKVDLNAAETVFLEVTEPQFHQLVGKFLQNVAAKDLTKRADELRRLWCRQLGEAAMAVFDQFVPVEAFPPEQAKPIVDAYKDLRLSFHGHERGGKRLYDALRLPLPQTAPSEGKSTRKAKFRSGRDE